MLTKDSTSISIVLLKVLTGLCVQILAVVLHEHKDICIGLMTGADTVSHLCTYVPKCLMVEQQANVLVLSWTSFSYAVHLYCVWVPNVMCVMTLLSQCGAWMGPFPFECGMAMETISRLGGVLISRVL